MGTDISTRQQEILDYIRDTVADRGYPPSVREIGEAVGLSSPSTVHSHLSTLEATGHLRRDPTKPRAIEILDEEPSNVRNVPLVGRIAAGSPILAEEDIEDVIPLPVDLVGDGPIFMLRVKGESMIDAGILDGDYVVIHRQPDALDGEIVAALIDGEEATVKRLQRREGAVILHSENPAFEPMVFTEGVELIGKVVAVFRGIR
ncbi:MAG: transcriptional repressor LexA [Acidimicrobiia bacterium]|nr:transcriptional repressor LexA [Acidimicrobiia bacterium]NNF87143.1 transcriptional repressor LexA [Acidimicrobiia bacterium]NNL14312.1 transcriptional repressor LexA [Acidimicrobiia bacterium]NNL69102.1 transcriptional repressor LexA [Acidimicrobiia bacterium]